ncbi:nucleotidyltransferase family protein [Paraburkholderia bonniea]|uniref:nucleotidyltransferase family protein n=1 Tax=Paraburkholderia bonniea TaxID=2152891 RepID=UPI0012914757|nr:nucleotidyltransferase family protein [Paraburkholderia bonniea]WJF92116.1 nucleotidyltransferase family protein [Paraburkholderia bonniea]WJF95436.1 nucleotidyltransferase family protein [Paraburkholderia bonniea]
MSYQSVARGILLAAGQGSRFDPSGLNNKLLAPLPHGRCVAQEAAERLLQSVPRVLAVVRPDAEPLARLLSEAGCDVMISAQAARGMGASLAAAVKASHDETGWIIALADMPAIAPASIEAVARALDQGAALVAPFYRAQRGHPVGVSAQHRASLAALEGDSGARALFAQRDYLRLELDDPGILLDIDTASDLGSVITSGSLAAR